MTTTRLDEWAAAGEALLQRAPAPETAWRLAVALLSPPSVNRPSSVAAQDLTLECQGEKRTLRAPAAGLAVLADDGYAVRFVVDGIQQHAFAVRAGASLYIALEAAVFQFSEASAFPSRELGVDPRRARAPVAGVVAQVLVSPGDAVSTGQPLVCVEAMKMEMWLNAGAAGTVKAVNVKAKDAVASGAVLVELDILE